MLTAWKREAEKTTMRYETAFFFFHFSIFSTFIYSWDTTLRVAVKSIILKALVNMHPIPNL